VFSWDLFGGAFFKILGQKRRPLAPLNNFSPIPHTSQNFQGPKMVFLKNGFLGLAQKGANLTFWNLLGEVPKSGKFYLVRPKRGRINPFF